MSHISGAKNYLSNWKAPEINELTCYDGSYLISISSANIQALSPAPGCQGGQTFLFFAITLTNRALSAGKLHE